MSVMKMKRVNICALRKNRKRILEALQHMGVMEIEALKDYDAEFIEAAPQKAVFERRAREAEQALEILDEYAPVKTSVFDSLKGKGSVDKKKFDTIVTRQESVVSKCGEIIRLKEQINAQQSRIIRIKGELEALEPWMSCDIPMGTAQTKSTDIRFGTLSAAVTEDDTKKALDGLSAHAELVSADKNTKYIALFSIKRDSHSAYEALRSLGFAKPAISIERTPSEHKERRLRHIRESEERIEEYKKSIRGAAQMRSDIKITADYYRVRAEKYGVLGTLVHTKKTFFITGYVPEKYAGDLCRVLEEKYGAQTETEECDDCPVQLENPAFASAFEPILESYGLPTKHEIDPSAIMGVFYVFLFGIMLSDAAYGAVISAACFILLRRFKNMEEGMRKSLKMFMYCGLSTLFWGIMFGGYFGDAVTVIAKTFFNRELEIPPLWFAPINEPMKLLMYSMLFGLIHLFTGLGIKGYMMLKSKDVKSFVCDVLSWFMLLIGLLLILMESSVYASLAGSSVNIGAAGDTAAKILAAAGALIILFTAGRDSKNFGKRLAKGAYSLYDITSWLSDLLSYSRLLALGLATGVVAQVVNMMGAMAGNGVFGAVLFIIVFIFGHIFNLAINLLGAYVHTNRLQYVEFFGKFYEGGARKFNPFKENTEYIKIKEEI